MKTQKKLFSFFLILCLLVCNTNLDYFHIFQKSSDCYAATTSSKSTIKKLYHNLDEKAQHNFDIIISSDNTLLQYHLQHIDKSYNKNNIVPQSAIISDLVDLNAELIAIDIPTSVRYAFLAAASGISAGIADGPLPIGDIIGIFTSIGALVVLAYNWPSIEKKWPSIITAFKKCFSSMATNITKTFSKLKVKIETKYYSQTFNRFEDHYQKHAKEFKDLPNGNGKKPSRKDYYNKAIRLLNKKGKDIIEGQNVGHPENQVKFNKKTLEFLVYNKTTKEIITYYLPRWKNYTKNNWTLAQWTEKALEYTLKKISQN